MADAAERLSELAPHIDHDLARSRFDVARRARRRRRQIANAGVCATVVTIVGLVIGPLVLGGDGTTAVTSTGGAAEVVQFVDLQRRDVRVALPPSLSEDFQVQAQHAALQLGPSGWRVDVTRSAEAASTDEADCQTPPDAVTGRAGQWHITFSGDGMTTSSCRALVDELAAFTVRNGIPAYIGTGRLGSIDSPDVAATSATADFSLFHRAPTCGEDARRTETGLLVERVDEPARGVPLTVLFDTSASIELWIQSRSWPSDEAVDAIEIIPRDEETTAVDVPTYELELAGAELVEDSPHIAANTDVALWGDDRGVWVSLTARPGLRGTYGAPAGLGPMERDDDLPDGVGRAWLSEPEDPRAATMWWVRSTGDLWILNAYWYGETMSPAPEATLRDWALGIDRDEAKRPPYVIGDPSVATIAFDPAGDKPSRSRVWDLSGQEIVLLVNEGSAAAGLSNLVARGAPTVRNVPNLGEVWSVGSTFGWVVPGSSEAWATLTVPDDLAERADELLRALRPTV